MPFSSLRAGSEGHERHGLTIAAFASTYGSDQVSAELPKKWLSYSQNAIVFQGPTQDLFHLAVAVHGLGEEGYAKLIGKKEPLMVWSKDRGNLLRRFRTEGGATHRDWSPNPVFGTAMSLIALQLDNEHLPIFRMKRNW
jgi:hypothetical protein